MELDEYYEKSGKTMTRDGNYLGPSVMSGSYTSKMRRKLGKKLVSLIRKKRAKRTSYKDFQRAQALAKQRMQIPLPSNTAFQRAQQLTLQKLQTIHPSKQSFLQARDLAKQRLKMIQDQKVMSGTLIGFDFGSLVSNISETVEAVMPKDTYALTTPKGQYSIGPAGPQYTSAAALTQAKQAQLKQTAGFDYKSLLPLALPAALLLINIIKR